MELKALRDQLEAERQAWVASCAKKEVGLDRTGWATVQGFLGLIQGVTPSCVGLWWSFEFCSLCTCGSRTVRLGTGGSGARDIRET